MIPRRPGSWLACSEWGRSACCGRLANRRGWRGRADASCPPARMRQRRGPPPLPARRRSPATLGSTSRLTEIGDRAPVPDGSRFPDEEWEKMRSRTVTASRSDITPSPYAFTEQGVAMLCGRKRPVGARDSSEHERRLWLTSRHRGAVRLIREPQCDPNRSRLGWMRMDVVDGRGLVAKLRGVIVVNVADPAVQQI